MHFVPANQHLDIRLHFCWMCILEPSSKGLGFPSVWVLDRVCNFTLSKSAGFELGSELMVESDLLDSKIEVELVS
jgi:hypothetical protein